jgi:dipeptidyl aminopeptidase/acylaminoacyl peptidase
VLNVLKFALAAGVASLATLAAVSGAAAAPAPPVEAYGKLPSLEEVSLSPSGKRLAMIAVVGEERRILVGPAGGKVDFAAKVGAAKVRSVEWAGDDHLLVAISKTANLGLDFDVDKAELYRLLVFAVPSGKSFMLFDKQNDMAKILGGEFGSANIGEHWYGFFGGVTYVKTRGNQFFLDHTYPDLYRVDLDSGDIKLWAPGSETTHDWVVGPDGRVLARAIYEQDHKTWRVATGAMGGKVLATGDYPFGGVGLSLGRTPDTVLVTRRTEERDIDEVIPLAGGPPAEVPDDDIIARHFHDRVSGLWIGYSTFGDQPAVKMFDTVADKRVAGARKAFPGETVRLASWSQDFNRMIVFTTGPGDPGTCWLVDIPSGGADPIGYEYPAITPEQVGPIKMIEWKAQDGLVIHGVLSLPPGREAKNLPIVVFPHGGPEARDYPVFDWWAQAFASRGYAVLQPNFRGSSDYGAAFRDAGFGQWGRKMQTDLSDGLADLARQGVVDPKRACIMGGSYGGYAALAGVTVQHGVYRCAVSVAGVSDPLGMIEYSKDEKAGDPNAGTRYWEKFMGGYAHIDEISPIKLAASADAPILLIHGKDDTIVPFSQSDAMNRALIAARKPVEFVVLPHEDHYLSREETRIQMLNAAVGFVEKYNPPDAAR